MKQITLKQMLKELVHCILKDKPLNTYYYKRIGWDTNEPEYIKITEIDLLRDRFKTEDDNFSTYAWSRDINGSIYKE